MKTTPLKAGKETKMQNEFLGTVVAGLVALALWTVFIGTIYGGWMYWIAPLINS